MSGGVIPSRYQGCLIPDSRANPEVAIEIGVRVLQPDLGGFTGVKVNAASSARMLNHSTSGSRVLQ
jgi:hypothetical protein